MRAVSVKLLVVVASAPAMTLLSLGLAALGMWPIMALIGERQVGPPLLVFAPAFLGDLAGIAAVAYVTGLSNVRDVIPFPRTPGNAKY